MRNDAKICRVFLGALLVAVCSGGCDASEKEDAYTVDTIRIASEEGSLARGADERLTVSVVTTEGRVLSEAPVAWQSSDPAVVAVDQHGMITALARGAATITATIQNKSDTEIITVIDVAGAWLGVYRASNLPGPDSIRYALNQTGQQVTGTFRSTHGFPPITDHNTGTITGALDIKRVSKTFTHTVRIPSTPCTLVFTSTFTLITRGDGRLLMKPTGDAPLNSDTCTLNGRISFVDLVYQP